MNDRLCALPAHALLPLLERGEVTCVALVEACLARIRALDGALRAFLTVYADEALANAARADERRRAGAARSPLDGVPVAVKGNLAVQGKPLSCASRVLEGYVSPYSATAVERLRAAGLPILGQTNLDEFAMGGSTEHSAFGPTRNPADATRVPGGSSGGSAAAVAAGMVPLALGSDTGGSIRQPAAYCGVCGLKPAYGDVSRYGLAAFASSLDCVGPLARDAEDCALLLGVLMGPDARDATCGGRPLGRWNAPVDWRGVRLGLWRGEEAAAMQPDAARALDAAAEAFARLGATVEPVALPLCRHALPTYYALACAEVGSNLARYDGVRYGRRSARCDTQRDLNAHSRGEGFGPEARRRVLLGAYALQSGARERVYQRAQRARDALTAELDAALAARDALLCPAVPTPAYRLGERDGDPTLAYRDDAFTVPFSLAGLPALSLPQGATAAGLPLAVQLVGPRTGVARLLALAVAYQKEARTHG